MGHGHDHAHDHLNHERHILWIAFFLNFPLFVLELWQGLGAQSSSMVADSMDFLSDSMSYLITLYVLTMPLHVRARASLFKAFSMLLVTCVALYQGYQNIITDAKPEYFTMGWVALLAVIANVTSAWLLYKTRKQDSNMSSIWLCSRNDALNNIFVLVAAGLVFLTGTHWPDLMVAAIIATLSASSAFQIIKQAKIELRQDVI